MGNLGFLFDIDKEIDECSDFYIGDIKLCKRKFVIFVFKENLNGNYIIGSSNFKVSECDFLFLNDDNQFSKFLLFEDSLFKSARIRVSNIRAVDYQNLTFWLEPLEYKIVYDLLCIRSESKILTDEVLYKLFELCLILYKN